MGEGRVWGGGAASGQRAGQCWLGILREGRRKRNDLPQWASLGQPCVRLSRPLQAMALISPDQGWEGEGIR